MNPKKLRKIILLLASLLFIILVISTLTSNMNNKKNNDATFIENKSNEETVYNFNETVDLDKVEAKMDDDSEIGTDYPMFGTVGDYYDNADVHYDNDRLYIQSYNGHESISSTWLNEGYAVYINEPQFGEMEKFILSPESSISATYSEVKMKDIISYINELSGLGFNQVILNKKNNGMDYYIYSAKKGDITVTLNYEKGKLVIMVF